MIKKRYILGIMLTLFMVITVATAVEDVSAAKYKKIDQGKKYMGNGTTAYWSAYYNGKTVKSTFNFYMKYPGRTENLLIGYMKVNFTKINKNKLNSSLTSNILGSKKSEASTIKTRLSAKSYYFKAIKRL